MHNQPVELLTWAATVTLTYWKVYGGVVLANSEKCCLSSHTKQFMLDRGVKLSPQNVVLRACFIVILIIVSLLHAA